MGQQTVEWRQLQKVLSIKRFFWTLDNFLSFLKQLFHFEFTITLAKLLK